MTMEEQGKGEYLDASEVRTGYVSGYGFTNKQITYTVVDGEAVFEGDIILGPAEEIPQSPRETTVPDEVARGVVISGNGFRWPNRVVFFTIDPTLPNQQRVTAAIQHWEARTNVRFQQRVREANFVTFRPGGGCSSRVGMVGGQQFITLGNGCGAGSTIHEIGHAVGLWHEQSREDRNRFVTVDLSNVDGSNQHNFNQHITDGDDVAIYDYGSIMHYGSTAFAVDPSRPTIISPQPIGQRNGLSEIDQRTVNAIYPSKVTLGETSGNGPAMATVENRMLVSWTGTGNLRLNFLSTTDGVTFGNKVTLGDTSPATPALTFFRNRFVVAWIGVGNLQLNFMRSADGVTWSDKVTLGDTSESAPALAVLGDWLYVAWRGVGNNHLNVMRSADGIHWQDKEVLGDTTTSGPALTVFDHRLLLAWRGVGNDWLNILRSYNGQSFYGKVTLGETTQAKPHLWAQPGNVYLGWQGVGNRQLNLISSSDGLDWSGKLTSRETCIDGPEVGALGNRLVRGWTGTDTAHRLNFELI